MAAEETSADISNISELDAAYIESFLPPRNLNISKIVEENELEYQQIRKQHERGFNPTMRSEAKRLKTFLSLPEDGLSTWATSEMAAAGFSYIKVKTAIQCFSCGLVLLVRSVETPPFEKHKTLWPSCDFILGKEVGNISKYDIRVQNPENNSLEVKNNHQEMESRLESFSNWPFYCKEIQPVLLAEAGFFFTGIKDTVQCFACSGCLGNWEEGDDPWKEHAKWFPECEFLQRKKSRDEIKQYIQSYSGFFGITGKHFTTSARKCLPSDPDNLEPFLNIYKDEEMRLESFKTWPQDAHADPAILAKVGFFYTGKNDTVQCLYCNGCLQNWKETEDPWEKHVKNFPHCKLSDPERWLSSENSKMQPESQHEKQTYYNENSNEIETVSSAMTKTLLANLDKYMFLKELSLDLSECQNMFDTTPEEFKNLNKIEKLMLSNFKFKTGSVWLVELIRNCPNLSLFHFQKSTFFDMGALMNAMSSCKKLTEILLNELNVGDEDLRALIAVLPNFTALKILNLSMLFLNNTETGAALALALRSLMNLEELVLPSGEGIRPAAKLIVQQCFHFPNLRKLDFRDSLSAEGLLEIAKVAADGGFQKLEILCLSLNHKIIEETWRNFFQALSNMPDLQNMDLSRIITHQIKCQAVTVKSFVQCVSRLPNLRSISMIGWLFDEKDLNMFEIMKEQHPQAKRLTLICKFILPSVPIINE